MLILLLLAETLLGRWAALHIDSEFHLLSRSPTGVLRDLRLAIVHCLWAGYLPAALLHVVRSGRRGGEMADLVAYRSLIENTPDWPFTTSTYTRLVLYMLIPVMSWGLGIFAEEIVNRVLF